MTIAGALPQRSQQSQTDLQNLPAKLTSNKSRTPHAQVKQLDVAA